MYKGGNNMHRFATLALLALAWLLAACGGNTAPAPAQQPTQPPTIATTAPAAVPATATTAPPTAIPPTPTTQPFLATVQAVQTSILAPSRTPAASNTPGPTNTPRPSNTPVPPTATRVPPTQPPTFTPRPVIAAPTRPPAPPQPVAPKVSGPVAPVGDGECPPNAPIKGNRSSMIYHSPGQQAYNRTKAEQCFATGADAQAAGYRPAQR